MQYLGGKFRTASEIVKVLRQLRQVDQIYLEPFCGSCWVVSQIGGKRIATDLHKDLILMWGAVQKGWQPPFEVTEHQYGYLRGQDSSPLRGFVGFGCSFSGKWFGGYARSGDRNYALNAANSVLKKKPLLLGVEFAIADYRSLSPKKMLIYCDPPYDATTKYSFNFNSDEFWEVMRQWASDNTVIVSEYIAPADFECIAEFPTKTDMHTKSGKEQRTEKLFKLREAI